MKTIKIFLASSEELKEERKELADIIANLNHILSRRDIFVDLVKWEYLDASMGPAHKQDEYNAELRECEMCIILYWTRFGIYTKTELDTAYGELKEGHNPRKLYVYFKDSDAISEELKLFRDSFPSKYGHFFTDFSNIDTLKAHFLLQFMDYMSKHLQGGEVVVVENSQVKVNGQTFVDLSKVPFAGNNEEYNLLLKNIKKTKKLLSISEPEDPEYSEYAQELQELEKKLAQMESSLWDTALMVTRLSSTKQSERLQRAVDLFNSGDNKGAMAVLKEEDIDRDVQHNLHLMELGEEGRKGLQTNIEEYVLRIKTLKNDMGENWGEEVLSLHKKILALAAKVNGEESLEVAKYQVAAANDFSLLGKHKDALEIGEKALSIRLKMLEENHPDVAESNNDVGCEHGALGDHQKALEYQQKALQIRLDVFGERHPDVAQSYNNVGYEYGELGDHQKALEYEEKALQIRLDVFGERHPDVARSYNNVGCEYGELGDHRKALEFKEKALQISLDIFGERHPDVATSYNNVGCEYSELGDHQKALEYKEKARQISLDIFGERHPDVAISYNNVGYEYGELGDHQKALEYRLKALEIAERIEDSNLIATFLNRVGRTYKALGQVENANDYFRRSSEKWKELGDEEQAEANLKEIESSK